MSSGSPVEGLVYDVFRPFGIGEKAVAPLVVELLRDETATVDFLMSFHHSLPPGNSSRTPLSSALTIAAGYFLGGFVPLRYVSPPSPVGSGRELTGVVHISLSEERR